MPDARIFTKKEIRFLEALSKRKVHFMVVGLSAATLQGAPVVTQDVDLWFEDLNDPSFHAALHDVGAVYVPPLEMNPPMIVGTDMNLFDIVMHMHGLDSYASEVRHTHEFSVGGATIKVLDLERIIQSKKTLNRVKDQLTIPVLEDTVRAREKKI